jgi:beta-fructofuranosidase
MGVPDGEEMLQPTRQRLDPPDDLPARAGVYRRQLYQRPLRELTALRGEAHGWQGNALPLAPMEIACKPPATTR